MFTLNMQNILTIMKKFTSRENHSFYLIQDIIEREVREAFRIRLSDSEKEVYESKRRTRST